MNSSHLLLLSKISLILFGYLLFYYLYLGIISSPTEMDSLTYHIPTAQHILQGNVISTQFSHTHQYFPGSSEVILALFMLLHIPLNLYNCLAVILLFIACYQLAKVSAMQKELCIVFAVAVCSSTGVLRWINTQTVDIWLAVYYTFALVLLLNPRNSGKYYLILGFLLGMIIGTKYSGPLFVLGLLFLFWKNLITYLNWKRMLLGILPVIIFGFSWYLRNYFLIHNPFYPLDLPFFQGIKGNPIIRIQVWKAIFLFPRDLFNAYIGEYLFWAISVVIVPILFIKEIGRRKTVFPRVTPLLFLGVINLCVFLILPSWDSYQNHVSIFRFSYPVFIPLILVVFLILSIKKKTEILLLVTILSMVTLGSVSYYPKLVLLYIPVAYAFFVIDQAKIKKIFPLPHMRRKLLTIRKAIR